MFLYCRIQGFYESTRFTTILVVCVTVVHSLFSHARNVSYGLYVLLATDRNQLRPLGSTEDTLATTADAVAAPHPPT
jgi:hypothetical protein